MKQEGEKRPAAPQGGQPRSSSARSSRPQRWDPRRTERAYSEPRDYQAPKQPDPARPAPVIQHRQRRSIAGFVGSLLGRKKEETS